MKVLDCLLQLTLFSFATALSLGDAGNSSGCAFSALDAGGKTLTFDLTEFNNPNNVLTATSSKSNTYWWAACGAPANCGGQSCQCTSEQAVCMKGAKDNWFGCGAWGQVTAQMNGTTLQLKYDGGVLFNNVPRFTVVACQCQEGAAPAMTSAVEDGVGGYYLYVTGNGCCAQKSGGGLGGWIFVIVVLCGLTAYCLVGVLFGKFVRHAEGTDMIPNYEFWQALPGLVKDGFQFSKDKFMGLIGKTPG